MPGLAVGPEGAAAGQGGQGPGFHGKVPARGDFVTRRLPRAFLDPWDGWLQAAIGCSRDQLGEDWLPAYLTCPVWRFALSAGLCGPHAAAGVVMPSVDRVGRYFPFVLAALLPDCGNPADLPAGAGGWFDGMETLALSALEDGFDLDRFDDDLQALGLPSCIAPGVRADGAKPAAPMLGWRIPLAAPDLAAAYPDALDRLLQAVFSRYSLWWTTRSEQIEPSLLVCTGLPRIAGYAAFLDGSWERWGWAAQPTAAAEAIGGREEAIP